MPLEIEQLNFHRNLRLLSRYIVDGFLTGLHKSGLKGVSSEFLEHKNYVANESTKYVDWKLYAKTDRLYTKQFQEETNLPAHIVLDNSSSMHFPLEKTTLENPNKIMFSALAIASLMGLLKRQRDTVGMSIFSDHYEFFAPNGSSERHHQILTSKLVDVMQSTPEKKTTKTNLYLRQVTEKVSRRSLIMLFTDMLQTEAGEAELFETLRYFKFKNHSVILFHIIDKSREVDLEYKSAPRRFLDVETGKSVDLFDHRFQAFYRKSVEDYFYRLKLKCMQYDIEYIPSDIAQGVEPILTSFLTKRRRLSRGAKF